MIVFIKIYILFPKFKMSVFCFVFKCHGTKVKKILDLSLYPDPHQSLWGLCWGKTHPPSKCNGNPFFSFCFSLLTDQQADTGENTSSLVEGVAYYPVWIGNKLPNAKTKSGVNRRQMSFTKTAWILSPANTSRRGWREDKLQRIAYPAFDLEN